MCGLLYCSGPPPEGTAYESIIKVLVIADCCADGRRYGLERARVGGDSIRHHQRRPAVPIWHGNQCLHRGGGRGAEFAASDKNLGLRDRGRVFWSEPD